MNWLYYTTCATSPFPPWYDSHEKPTVLRNGLNSRTDCRHPRPPQRHFLTERLIVAAYHQLLRPVVRGHAFKEEFLFVSGFQVNDSLVWDQLAGVAYETHSASGVVVEKTSSRDVLTGIREAGQYLVGHLHTHPGFGADANYPSPIDDRFAHRLACGHSVALGGIISRGESPGCAYLRFFSSPLVPFEVTLIGNNIERLQYDQHNYRLQFDKGFVGT